MQEVKLTIAGQSQRDLSRRQVIKWMSAAAATISILDARNFSSAALPTQIGSDPNLLAPVIPWQKTMTKPELRTAAALCDIIIPADDKSPSASSVGVPEFIDEWISAPYPQQQADRAVVLQGLAWLNVESNARFKKVFAELELDQADAICRDIYSYANAASQFKNAAEFFARFRSITLGAFYTTPEGMKDIQYIGNIPLATFDGPPPEVLKHLGLA